MSDADRLFVACVVMVAVYVFRVWDARRRRFRALMAAHCACVELARVALENGFDNVPPQLVERLTSVEKGMGIRE